MMYLKDASKCVFMVIFLAQSPWPHWCVNDFVNLVQPPFTCHGSMLQDNRPRLCYRAFSAAVTQSSDAMLNKLLHAHYIMCNLLKTRQLLKTLVAAATRNPALYKHIRGYRNEMVTCLLMGDLLSSIPDMVLMLDWYRLRD